MVPEKVDGDQCMGREMTPEPGILEDLAWVEEVAWVEP